jgi:predicted aspartyl protease
MGVFRVGMDVANLERARFETVDAWVDTGAFYSSVPRPLLEALGVIPEIREPFLLADGRTGEADIGWATVRVNERTAITMVLFGEPESPALLGAYTLEALRFVVDPKGHRLVPRAWVPRFHRGRPVPQPTAV